MACRRGDAGGPATELADKLGSTLLANMVMLGAYVGWTQVLGDPGGEAALEALIKRKELLESDIKAIEAGVEWAKSAQPCPAAVATGLGERRIPPAYNYRGAAPTRGAPVPFGPHAARPLTAAVPQPTLAFAARW